MYQREPWSEIVVDVEPAHRNFRVSIERETRVQDVVQTILNRCNDEGIDVKEMTQNRVGSGNVSLVLMRKGAGNQKLAPTIEFGTMEPTVERRERFTLDATPVVG